MRNLKRALSLGMTAAMISSLMVVSSSAASYTDVTSKNNEEAIEVLKTVGVMVGDENGKFNPDSKVTRNEMAVVISNLMDYNVATYKGTSPFTDVPSWAEPYVAACYTNGNTAGYTATYYGGSDNVTTGQAALMLMKALGYFQYQSDFESDWQLATTKQGYKIDLFKDVDAAVREDITRNELAQLVLNTLKAGTVEATSDITKVEAGDVKVETGKVEYSYITSSNSYARSIKQDKPQNSGTSTSSGQYIVELGEKLFDGDLKMKEDVTDDFGRPATKWNYKTNEIGTFGDDPILTSTAKVTLGDMYDLLGSANVNDLSVKKVTDEKGNTSLAALEDGDENKLVVYQDGELVTDTVKTYFDRNSTNGALSGKGVLTEVYQDDDNNVTIVYVNTYVAQATADYSSKKGSVNVTVLTKPTDANEDYNYKSFKDLADDDFEAVKDLKEDDYVLYTYAKGEVQDIVKGELVTGEVTAYSAKTGKNFSDASGSVSIDSTKYDYAKYAEVDSDNGCAVTYSVGVDASVVTDANGYVYYVDDATASTGNYVYIDAIAKSGNLGTDVVADAYFGDGTNSEIKIKTLKGTDGKEIDTSKVENSRSTTNDGTTTGTNIQGWYQYSKNSSDKYTLTLAETSDKMSSVTVKTDKVSLGGKYTGNKDTVFVVVDDDDDVTVYTGIANVPDLTIGSNGYGYAMKDKDKDGKAASLVYVDVGDDGKVKNSSKDSLIYLLNLDSTSVNNSDNEDVYTWNVVKDGEETTIQTKENWTENTLLEDYTTDSDGYYEAGDVFDAYNESTGKGDSDKYKDVLSGATVSQSGNTLTVGSRTIATNDDTKVYLIMNPSASKSSSDTLRGQIMTDWSADYEVELNSDAKGVANMLKGYTVNGACYVTYDDASESDLALSVYIVVTSAK